MEISIQQMKPGSHRTFYDLGSKVWDADFDNYTETTWHKILTRALDLGNAFYAADNESVVGAGAYLKLHEFDVIAHEYQLYVDAYNGVPDAPLALEEHVKVLALLSQREEPVNIRYGNQGEIVLSPHDVYLAHMVVDQKYQKQGIGKALASARMKHVQDEGASNIFVRCQEPGHSMRLYTSLGFKPVVHLDPAYEHDKPAVVMCKQL